MSDRRETNEMTAELYATEVAYCLGIIARGQHRISCALASEHRPRVLDHLRSLGISEQAATAFVSEPLSHDDMLRVSHLLETIQGWRPHLAEKVRAIAVANKS